MQTSVIIFILNLDDNGSAPSEINIMRSAISAWRVQGLVCKKKSMSQAIDRFLCTFLSLSSDEPPFQMFVFLQ